MVSRFVSTFLALVMAAPAVAPQPMRPRPLSAADASHSAACCCTPCPGTSTCPCGHGAAAQEVCGKAQDPMPLAVSTPAPLPASRLACELPAWAPPELHPVRHEAADLRPPRPCFAEPPEKVPIA